MSWSNFVGKPYSIDGFADYVKKASLDWSPRGVTIHHSASPSLADRPDDFTHQHMLNLKDFYQNDRRWSTGPHLFIDRKQIWVFMSIGQQGIHAKSFNRTHFGIEMLGDYDSETPHPDVIYLAYSATSLLLKKIGRSPASVNFHRDDPKTTKTCPGVKVQKSWFIPGLTAVFDNPSPSGIKVHIVKDSKILPITCTIHPGASISTAPLSQLETVLLDKRSSVEDHEVGVASFLKVNGISFSWEDSTKSIILGK